mmetsp:Transcript_35787/g.86386  ORF Transcript_35787/g.86386 Transcript_35787/m.86386 type:complete len:86 (+) Transcript_35787:607-864(+)
MIIGLRSTPIIVWLMFRNTSPASPVPHLASKTSGPSSRQWGCFKEHEDSRRGYRSSRRDHHSIFLQATYHIVHATKNKKSEVKHP